MKKVTRCYECKCLIRKYGSYSAVLDKPELNNGMMISEITLCRECTKQAGYKVRELKDE